MSKYERKAAPIRELVQNPDVNQMANALTKGTEGLHGVAPNIAQSLQVIGARALNYLHSQMPKPSSEMVGDQDYEPSKTQQRDWLHSHDIVNDPISVLDHVRHGTLTSKHMDALSQVHPELLNEMREKVMGEMEPAKVKNLPSSTKQSLSLFLGNPITQSVTPQSILANQTAIQGMMAPQSPPGSPKSTVAGLKDLKVGQRAATQSDDLEEPQ